MPLRRRPRRAALAVALVLACGGFALPGLAGSASAAPATTSAACDTTWVPPKGDVIVFPQPNTDTANPHTQIQIRGLALGRFGAVRVVGSRSGTHRGHWRSDSDGKGASFYPSKPFDPGETVTVSTHLRVVNGRKGAWHFRVSVPVADAPNVVARFRTDGKGVRVYNTTGIRPAAVNVSATGTTAPGDIFVAPKPANVTGVGRPGPEILGPTGSLIWFRGLYGGTQAFNFRTQQYRGKPVLTWWQGYTVAGHGHGVDVMLNDHYQTIATVHAGNGYVADLHEFQITPEHTALITAYQPVHFAAGRFNGIAIDSILQEIDIPTGNVLFEWHSLDHVWLRDSYLPVNDDGYDYFHINSGSLDNVNDGFLISARNTNTEYFVSRYTGDIQWEIGGKHSTMGSQVRTIGQHDAKWLSPTQISVFDDGSGAGPTTEQQARGLVVNLDCSAHQATIDQEFDAPGGPVVSQGSMQPLPGGGAFLGMGSNRWFYEFSGPGTEVLSGAVPNDDQSYRTYLQDWHGYPTTSPAVKAVRSGSGLVVYVSWNGATDVTGWQVTGGQGTDPSTWSSADSVNATHQYYEDDISTGWTADYVQVTALNSIGEALGRSAVVPVSG